MALSQKFEAQNPLILRSHRLMESFAKSDDERDFYLDRYEGFIIYIDLDKSQEEIEELESELFKNRDRYCLIPKLTFYEAKKIMEGFVNEKVYDIDTKEKLLDIIQSKEARSNFLEFIYDHHNELEKWQQYYQERSRIRIIEWLRNNHFHFVFEEDLELPKAVVEKLKSNLFQAKVGKDILAARKTLFTKAKTYYSNEALNPRPKRGRPPKQAVKQEVEPQVTIDIYTTVPTQVRPFLFTPDISSASATFSSKFVSDTPTLLQKSLSQLDIEAGDINQKLASLRSLSNRWVESDSKDLPKPAPAKKSKYEEDEDDYEDEEDEDEEDEDDFFAKDDEEDLDEDEDDYALLTKSAKSAPKAAAAKSKMIASKPVQVARKIEVKESKSVAKKVIVKEPVKKPAVKTNTLQAKIKPVLSKPKPKTMAGKDKKARIMPKPAKEVLAKIKPVIKVNSKAAPAKKVAPAVKKAVPVKAKPAVKSKTKPIVKGKKR